VGIALIAGVLSVSFCLATAVVGAPAAGATVTHYTKAGVFSPYGIAPGPGGTLWFTTWGPAVGRITTSGTITRFSDPSMSTTEGITTGPDGAVWFTNYGMNSIGRITTTGSVTSFTDQTVDGPTGITTGPDGALWFTNRGGNSIGRITTDGTITNFADATIAQPVGITTGPDGALWFTNGNSSIGRISTGGVISNYVDPSSAGSGPQGIVTGPDGALWFTNQYKDSIGRITTAGNFTKYTDTRINGSFAIAVGHDHALWFTIGTAGNHDAIGRITTTGVITDFPDPSISIPHGIAAGSDGAMWFTNEGANSIGRITETPAPNPPTGVHAASRSTTKPTGALVVAYSDGANAGRGVNRFVATCKSSNGGVTKSATHSGTTPAPITVGGVTTGRSYSCAVQAGNQSGLGPASASSLPFIEGAPGTPMRVRATRPKAGTLKIDFTAPPDNGAPITNYNARCTSSNGGAARVGTHAAGPIPVTNLSKGRAYTCVVRATNHRGISPASQPTARIVA